jgi:hypothetical protein
VTAVLPSGVVTAVDCPSCKGAGRIYDDTFGSKGAACGDCLGFGEVTREKCEQLLDARPVTRGEVKRMITAIRAESAKETIGWTIRDPMDGLYLGESWCSFRPPLVTYEQAVIRRDEEIKESGRHYKRLRLVRVTKGRK